MRKDIPAARKVYSAPWKSIRIAPLDSCGILRLNGNHLKQVRKSSCPLTSRLIESVDCWAQSIHDADWPERSSILFDTVAAYLCFGSDLLKIEQMKLIIDERGFMCRTDSGAPVACALDWRDIDGFKKLLSERLA